MKDEILEFIKRRFRENTESWMSGNCYWFGIILTTRFSNLRLYYLPMSGHFMAIDEFSGVCYDAEGTHELSDIWKIDKPIPFDVIKENDPLWYENIFSGCIK